MVIFESAARTATAESKRQGSGDYAGGIFTLNVTAVSGTAPTLDVKLQHRDAATGNFIDIPGASFAQRTTAGADTLILYPSVGTVANRSVSSVLGDEFRAVATIAGTTPSFTFSLSFDGVK